jgi:site-specific DNA recombinase
MHTPRKYRTGLYGRTSKDDPRRVTIDIQKKALHDWAGRDPLVSEVTDEYWDDGITGKLPLHERPEGRRLLADVQAGRIEAVAVAYVDRFGRTLLDGLQAVKALEDRGVKLVAVEDGWDARRNDGPLYFQFRMMMAEEEHRRIRERMQSGKSRAMARDNAPPGGPLTFGYRMDEHGQYVADAVEAAVVVRIFELFLLGHSQPEILAWVRTLGVPAGRRFQKRAPGSEPHVAQGAGRGASGQWHCTKVSKILRNRTYLGERRWKERVFPCTPLVDPETFDRVQARLLERDRGAGIGKAIRPEKGLLSGLLTCGTCGGTFYLSSMTQKRADGTSSRYPTYMCESARGGGWCGCKVLRVNRLDADVWSLVESYLDDPAELVRKVVAADARLGGDVAELDAAEGRLLAEGDAVEAEVKGVWDEQRANGWPLAWVTPRLNELHARREQVAAELQAVRQRRGAVLVDRDQAAEVTAALAGIRARLAVGLSAEEKYSIIRRLVAGGVVKTVGTGRQKMAEITLQLRWGEHITAQGAGAASHSPDCPGTGATAEKGMETLPCVLHYGRTG